MSRPAGVGLVVAMTSEARLLSPRARAGASLSLPGPVQLCVSGMGQTAAQAAASQLLAAGVGALAVFGVAGGLDPDYACGSLICASEVIGPEGQRYPTDPDWRRRLQQIAGAGCRSAPILSLAQALSTPAAKHQAARQSGAVAVDMESAAVAAVAAAHGKPLLVLRAVADEAGDVLPPALQAAVDDYGQPRPAAMLATLLGHPGLIPALPGLARRMRMASLALQQLARQSGPDLGWQALGTSTGAC